MEIQKREIVKVGLEIIVSAGVGIIANNAINMVLPHNLSRPKQLLTKVGSFALVLTASSAATERLNLIIDRVAEGISEGKKRTEAEVARMNEEAVAYLNRDMDATEKMMKDPNEPISSTLEGLEFPNEGAEDDDR